MIKVIRTLSDVFFLMRPTLLIPVWTILALGWITGSEQNAFGSLIGGGVSFALLSLSFTLIAGFIFVLNQIADVEGDRENGKLFILPEKHLSLRFARIYATLLLTAGLLIPTLFMRDLAATIIIAVGALLGFAYSLKPFSFKDRPWGGTWANFAGHGVITYYAGWYGAQLDAGVTLGVEEYLWGVLFSLSAGFANAAVYLTSTIPDAEGDAKVGKITFAVRYGGVKTALTAAIFVTLSLAFALLLPYNSWVMWITALLSTTLFWLHYVNFNSDHSFATFRWPVMFLSIVMTIYIPVYAVLVLSIVLISKFYYKKRFNLNYPSMGSE